MRSPENSLEYSKIQSLAKKFYEDFKDDAQIFITTHSPAFIKLKDKESVKTYRVYIDPRDGKQISKILTLEKLRLKQLKLSKANETDTEEYTQLSKELNFVELAEEIESAGI